MQTQPAPAQPDEPGSATSRVPLLEYALLLLLATLWGASFSLLKITVASVPPLTAIAVRTAIAGGLLLWVMRWQRIRLPLDRQSMVSFTIVSAVNTVAPFMLIAWGLQWVDAGLAVILNSTTPILAFLITFFLLGPGKARSEQITPRKVLGVAVGITGIVMIVGTEALTGLGRQLVPQFAIVLSSLCYAASAVYGGGTFRGMNPIAPAAGSLLIGAAMLTPMALIVEQPWTASPTATSLLSLLVLGIVCTALGNVLYFRLLGTLGTLGTTAQSYLRVPIGVLVGMLLLGEQMTTTAGIGLVCVVAGVAAMTISAPLPASLLAWAEQWLRPEVWRAHASTALGVMQRAGDRTERLINRRSPLTLEYLLLVVIATLWAGSYVWIKIALVSIPPLSLMAGRVIIAGLFLLAVLRVQGKRMPLDRASWRLFAWQGMLASVLPFTLVAWGQQWVEAGPTAILNSISPVFAFLITWGITRHEPASRQKLFGVLAGLLGVAVVIGPSGFSGAGFSGAGFTGIGGRGQLVAQMAIVLSSFCYACAAIYTRNFKTTDPVVTAAGSMLTGAVVLIPAALLFERPWALQPSAASLGALVALGLLSTALGFVIYFRLARTLGPMGVTAQSYMRAPIGVLLAALLLGEALTASMLAGLVLVVIGVAAMTLPNMWREAKA